MPATARLIALTLGLWGQVPPPDAPARDAEVFRRDLRTILQNEAEGLSTLTEALSKRGELSAAAAVRRGLPPPPPPGGASRFVPLPPVVPARTAAPVNGKQGGEPHAAWITQRDSIRATAAESLFRLAARAAAGTPKRYALADSCLRGVLERDPSHAEARRLLGFVAFEGGWATPFAVEQIKKNRTLHSTYGWVKTSWVSHLENGELPSRVGLSQGREVFIPAARADAERSEWASAWMIETEHFQIRTNVPLAEAIRFGRDLEDFHQLFLSVFADVIGESLPLARRCRAKGQTTEKREPLHAVSYFATKTEFADYLRPQQPEIDESLGLYLRGERGRRGHAYFFRDRGGEIDVTSTLFHEVSHELLFESGVAGANDFKQNVGNYWVFEGLGTYFETLRFEADGSILYGGMVGPRIAEARINLVPRSKPAPGRNLDQFGKMVPFAQFVRYDKDAFNDPAEIYLHYQQAIAMTTFFMQAHERAYREGFLEYVRDACKGNLRRTTGQPLDVRVGKTYAEIETEFIAYLRGPEETLGR